MNASNLVLRIVWLDHSEQTAWKLSDLQKQIVDSHLTAKEVARMENGLRIVLMNEHGNPMDAASSGAKNFATDYYNGQKGRFTFDGRILYKTTGLAITDKGHIVLDLTPDV